MNDELEARKILAAMQQWRDADNSDSFELTRHEVIVLIECVRAIDEQTLGDERADALRRMVMEVCRKERLTSDLLSSLKLLCDKLGPRWFIENSIAGPLHVLNKIEGTA